MIIFLYGTNDFKIHQKSQELQDKFIREIDASGQNIWKIDGEKMKEEDFSSQLGSSSLFVSKKMVIISDLIKNKQKDFLKKLLGYIQKNKLSESSDIFVIIEKNIKNKGNKGLLKTTGVKDVALNSTEKSFFNFLIKEKYSQELGDFSNLDLIKLIKKELAKYSLEIDNRLAQTIINLTAGDPWAINNEVKKIAHFKLENRGDNKINSLDIDLNVQEKTREDIFAFIDAISVRNTEQALKILEEQYLAGSEPIQIINMLIRQFKILLQIKEAIESNLSAQKITNQLKLHPFIVNKGLNQARNFTKDFLRGIINQLISLDQESRSNSQDLAPKIALVINKL